MSPLRNQRARGRFDVGVTASTSADAVQHIDAGIGLVAGLIAGRQIDSERTGSRISEPVFLQRETGDAIPFERALLSCGYPRSHQSDDGKPEKPVFLPTSCELCIWERAAIPSLTSLQTITAAA